MQKDIAERLKEFPTLVKLAMLGDVVSAQAVEVFSRDAILEIEALRAFVRDVVAVDPLAGGGDAKYFVTADFIARARALV